MRSMLLAVRKVTLVLISVSLLTVGAYEFGTYAKLKDTNKAEFKVINIYGEIKDGGLAEQIKVVSEADQNDTIILNVNSGGGLVSEASKMVKALYFSKAKFIIANVQQQASSAAFDIVAFTDRIVTVPISVYVLHLGSFGGPEPIDLTLGMDTSKLHPADRIYVQLVGDFMKELMGRFMAPEVYTKILKTTNTAFRGEDLLLVHPTMEGWRHDRVLFLKFMAMSLID